MFMKKHHRKSRQTKFWKCASPFCNLHLFYNFALVLHAKALAFSQPEACNFSVHIIIIMITSLTSIDICLIFIFIFRPGVSLGYSLLHSMVDFVGTWTTKEEVLKLCFCYKVILLLNWKIWLFIISLDFSQKGNALQINEKSFVLHQGNAVYKISDKFVYSLYMFLG